MVSPRELLDFAQTHNLIIFEDSAQAHLAKMEGCIAGGVGKAAGFSFYPSKNLGAFGNGGIVITNDESVAVKMRSLRNYGAPKKYYHTELGTNSRLDTIQAAILNVKLPHLSAWNEQRNTAAKYYDLLLQTLKQQDIFPITNATGSGHVYHLYIIHLNDRLASKREQIQQQMAEKGIQTGIHYPIPCHLQPAYQYLGYQVGDFPVAETLCSNILSLPMYPGISKPQIELVVEELSRIIKQF